MLNGMLRPQLFPLLLPTFPPRFLICAFLYSRVTAPYSLLLARHLGLAIKHEPPTTTLL